MSEYTRDIEAQLRTEAWHIPAGYATAKWVMTRAADELVELRAAASEADALRAERDELKAHLSACRSECDQLRAEWHDVIERTHEQAATIALNKYVTPPFDLVDDDTVGLALECAEKDAKIAEQARQIETARELISAVAYGSWSPDSVRPEYRVWMYANAPGPPARTCAALSGVRRSHISY